MVDGRTLDMNQLPQRVCAHSVYLCVHMMGRICVYKCTRSAPKTNPQSLSIITQFAVQLSYFWQRAQSVLRPGLELELQSIKVHLDRLPLNLVLQLCLKREHPGKPLHPATSILCH